MHGVESLLDRAHRSDRADPIVLIDARRLVAIARVRRAWRARCSASFTRQNRFVKCLAKRSAWSIGRPSTRSNDDRRGMPEEKHLSLWRSSGKLAGYIEGAVFSPTMTTRLPRRLIAGVDVARFASSSVPSDFRRRAASRIVDPSGGRSGSPPHRVAPPFRTGAPHARARGIWCPRATLAEQIFCNGPKVRA